MNLDWLQVPDELRNAKFGDHVVVDDRLTLTLASISPRRRALFDALGLNYEAVSPDFDEMSVVATAPRGIVMQTAMAKVRSIVKGRERGDKFPLVIGCDTLVFLGDRRLGKPEDRDDAVRMLELLSGRTHDVYSGLAVQLVGGGMWVNYERTRVTFRKLERPWIENYVATGDADDKAGAYGVQEIGEAAIGKIEGDISNVIGLPLWHLRNALFWWCERDVLKGRDFRAAVLRAFPELQSLPDEFWSGLLEDKRLPYEKALNRAN